MSTAAYQARRTITEEKKAGTLLNAAGRLPVKSVIFLDNGTVIASPLTVTRILSAIERANSKSLKSQKASQTARLKVYDVVDEDPNEHDEQYFELSALLDDCEPAAQKEESK